MKRLAVAALVVAVAWSPPAVAAERDFALTWTTATLAPGARDVEAWLTPRIAAKTDDTVRTETRAAVTAGLVPGLETSLGFDLGFDSTYAGASVDPRLVSLWKLAPLKATDVLGLGVLARFSLGLDVLELEARLLVDKQVGRLLLALNASYERSVYFRGRTGVDSRLEESFGFRYALGDSAAFGFELLLKSAFIGADYQGTGVSVGPTLAVKVGRTWLSFGAYAQVAADKAPADKGNGEPLELRDNHRFVLRLALGSRVP